MKALFVSVLLACCASTMQADDYFHVKSGDVSAMNTQATACLSFDYRNAEIVFEQEGLLSNKVYTEDWDDDWSKYARKGEARFLSTFNAQGRSLTLTADSAQAACRMIVKVRKVEIYSDSEDELSDINSLFGDDDDGGEVSTTISGRIVFQDAGGSNLCVLTFENIEGNAAGDYRGSFRETYADLAKRLSSYLKKRQERDSARSGQKNIEKAETLKRK